MLQRIRERGGVEVRETCKKCGKSYKRPWESIIYDNCKECISKRVDYDDCSMLVRLLGVTVGILAGIIVLLVYFALS